MIKCEICGENFEESEVELINLEGKDVYVCNGCKSELKQCYECDTYYHKDDLVYLENYDTYVCRNCLEENYYVCDYCGDYISIDSDDYYTDHNGNPFCCNCRDYYYYCDRCGEYFREDEGEWYSDDYGDDTWYCYNCLSDIENENRERVIKSYHDRDIPISFKYSSKQLQEENYNEKYKLKFGFELEVENAKQDITNNEAARYIRDNYENLELVFEHDGSLDDGFEIITQPMTLDYIKEHRTDFQDILKYLSDKGFKSHDTNTCGLHIHFSREYFGFDNEKQNEYTDKLLYFFENYKKEIQKFSRRKNYNYCNFISDYYSTNKKETMEKAVKSMEVIKTMKDSAYGHGVALNLENSNTIEVRIFKGTLKFETLMASIEFVNNLVRTIKETKKLSTLSWENVINRGGKYLKNYVDNLGIVNKDKLKDNTEELKKEYTEKTKLELNKSKNVIVLTKELVDNLQQYIIKLDMSKSFDSLVTDEVYNNTLTELQLTLTKYIRNLDSALFTNVSLFNCIFSNYGIKNTLYDTISYILSYVNNILYSFRNENVINALSSYVIDLKKIKEESDN